MKQKLSILIPAAFFLLWLPLNAMNSGNITVEHLESLNPYSYDLKTKNYNNILETIKKKEVPSFIESFLAAELLLQDGKGESAVSWYARSAFLHDEAPGKPYPSVIIPFLKRKSSPSPLYREALYEIARSFLKTHGPKYAMEVLKMLPDNPGPAMQSRVYLLNSEILRQVDWKVSRDLYEALIEIDDKSYYHLKLAGIWYTVQDHEKALKEYFYILENSQSAWEKKIAIEQIQKIIELKSVDQKLSNHWKILLAEGLRAQELYAGSLKQWKSIPVEKLTPEELGIYLKYSSRLWIKIKQFRKLETLVKRYRHRLLPEDAEQLQEELAVSLYRAEKYHMALRLIEPQSAPKRALLYRLLALEKIEAPGREIEAGRYLQNFDQKSDYAEEIYFKVCFKHLKNKKQDEAKECLTRLKDLTPNVPSGGRSRFYLARLLENQGKKIEALAMYREVYLNSPSHFYAFTALKHLPPQDLPMPQEKISTSASSQEQSRQLQDLRVWLANHYSNPEAIALYFQKKKDDPGFGVDPYWQRIDQQLQEVENGMDHNEQMTALYSAMGFTWRGSHYRAQITDKRRLYLAMFAGAKATRNENLKYRYFSAIMHLDDKEADVMTLSQEAAESLFPVPYRDIVQEAGKEFLIDEAHVYALMKQESAFHPGATSRSGAMGLMQIMPSTAKWLNNSMKIRSLNLYNPAHAIPMAAKFYSYLYQSNGGILEKVAVAYNAGPARLRQWLRQFDHESLEFFLEEIPVYETYNYVQKTRRYYDRYKILLTWYYPGL